MLGHRRKRLQELSFAVDAVAGLALLCVVFLFLLWFAPVWQSLLQAATGYPFRVNPVGHLAGQAWLLLLPHLCLLLALRLTGYYEVDLASGWTPLVRASVRGAAAGVAATALLLYMLGVVEVNRSLVLLFGCVFPFYQVPKELLLRSWWMRGRAQRLDALLVCGAEEAAARLTELEARPRSGVKVRAIHVDGGAATLPPAVALLRTEPGPQGVGALLARGGFDVVLLGNSTSTACAQSVLAAAEEQGVDVWFFTRFPIPLLAQVHGDDFAGHPVLVFRTGARYESRLALKRGFDIVVASLLLLLATPLMLGIAAGIKLTSRGPVLFTQVRTGWRGRPFRIIKFRSMRHGTEGEREALASANLLNGPAFKLADDPRITPLGRWLRRYSLDELPQLFNVLRGEMSLVGPRPLPVAESSRMPALRDYRRLSVLPGMTGLWQVSGRASLRDFDDWVRLDLQYIDQWSFGLDALILLKTLPAVLRGSGAH